VGGATLGPFTFASPVFCFNPRAPWGARLESDAFAELSKLFQSTRPVGGATYERLEMRATIAVSIHAPRGGRDRDGARKAHFRPSFNPRAPWGARLNDSGNGNDGPVFQSTRPVGGATEQRILNAERLLFQSTRPVGGATASAACR